MRSGVSDRHINERPYTSSHKSDIQTRTCAIGPLPRWDWDFPAVYCCTGLAEYTTQLLHDTAVTNCFVSAVFADNRVIPFGAK